MDKKLMLSCNWHVYDSEWLKIEEILNEKLREYDGGAFANVVASIDDSAKDITLEHELAICIDALREAQQVMDGISKNDDEYLGLAYIEEHTKAKAIVDNALDTVNK